MRWLRCTDDWRQRKGRKKLVTKGKWSPPTKPDARASCLSVVAYLGSEELSPVLWRSKPVFFPQSGCTGLFFPSHFPCTSLTPKHSNQDRWLPFITLLETANWKLKTENWKLTQNGSSDLPLFLSHFRSISKSCLFLLLNIIPSLSTTALLTSHLETF